jgi:D-serine deaminase-like pyridoxal phosphate-dependent protein
MRIDQLDTPALVLDMDTAERNIAAMRRVLEPSGIALRPHYKSHKCTHLAQLQIAAGAKGMTCAKLDEAEDLVLAGVEDILLANQITAPAKIERLAELARLCRLTVCADDADNIDALSRAAVHHGSTIYVLVEFDIGMGRCGVNTIEQFVPLARRIADASGLEFEGIQAYAGHLAHVIDIAEREKAAERIEASLTELKQAVEASGLTVKEVSGGSTGTAVLRKSGTAYTEHQAGSYLMMDATYGDLDLPFEQALYLIAGKVSAVNGRLTLDAGEKALSTDQAAPVLRDFPDWAVRLNEEHAKIAIPDGAAEYPDKYWIIPGHCCTTMNLHSYLTLIRGDRVVDRVPIVSRGRAK